MAEAFRGQESLKNRTYSNLGCISWNSLRIYKVKTDKSIGQNCNSSVIVKTQSWTGQGAKKMKLQKIWTQLVEFDRHTQFCQAHMDHLQKWTRNQKLEWQAELVTSPEEWVWWIWKPETRGFVLRRNEKYI